MHPDEQLFAQLRDDLTRARRENQALRSWARRHQRITAAFRKWLRWILTAHLLSWGLVYVAGPARWASSSSFEVLRALGPIRAWAGLFLLAAVLLAVGFVATGLCVAAISSAFWGFCLVAAAVTGDLTGGGGLAHTGLITALHLLCLRHQVLAREGRAGG